MSLSTTLPGGAILASAVGTQSTYVHTSPTSPAVTYTSTPSTITNGWANTAVSTSWANSNPGSTFKIAVDAEFEGDLKIKGVNLTARLDAIEERLGILRPNNDLEGKWEKLKALGDEYRTLEKDILEKEKIWDLLRK
jgi:hypothetical protein